MGLEKMTWRSDFRLGWWYFAVITCSSPTQLNVLPELQPFQSSCRIWLIISQQPHTCIVCRNLTNTRLSFISDVFFIYVHLINLNFNHDTSLSRVLLFLFFSPSMSAKVMMFLTITKFFCVCVCVHLSMYVCAYRQIFAPFLSPYFFMVAPPPPQTNSVWVSSYVILQVFEKP